MAAVIVLHCDCGDGNCPAEIGIPADSTTSARATAKDHGWDCDVIGGTTVDWAPGHEVDD